ASEVTTVGAVVQLPDHFPCGNERMDPRFAAFKVRFVTARNDTACDIQVADV
ncbi:hypothetical protein M514_21585, partial [Trichuris suis]